MPRKPTSRDVVPLDEAYLNRIAYAHRATWTASRVAAELGHDTDYEELQRICTYLRVLLEDRTARVRRPQLPGQLRLYE